MSQLASCRLQLMETKEAFDRHMLEVAANTKEQQAAAQEEKIMEKGALTKQYEK